MHPAAPRGFQFNYIPSEPKQSRVKTCDPLGRVRSAVAFMLMPPLLQFMSQTQSFCKKLKCITMQITSHVTYSQAVLVTASANCPATAAGMHWQQAGS
jgi:S-adenosylhomocysteine hydrolase